MSVVTSLVCLATAAVDHQRDVGYNAIQVNYELLTKSIDPDVVLGSMFSHKILSLEEKEKISSVQVERGKSLACEKMLDMLLKRWKKGTCVRFIQVLQCCKYEECAEQIQSNSILHELHVLL